MRNETDVRHWLAKCSAPLTWTEAGRGGTIGAADCLLHGEVAVPIECKFWGTNARGTHWQAQMRPLQIRYHAIMAKRKSPTLIIWGASAHSGVWTLAGCYAPHAVRENIAVTLPVIRHYLDGQQDLFERDIQRLAFWPGWALTDSLQERAKGELAYA